MIVENPYKIGFKNLASILSISLLVVITVSFGLSYVEKILEPRLALAQPIEYTGQIFTYNDGYLGEFGKSYLVDNEIEEVLFSLK